MQYYVKEDVILSYAQEKGLENRTSESEAVTENHHTWFTLEQID